MSAPLTAFKEDFMGAITGVKAVDTNDINSALNKAYAHPLDDNGGVTYKQGIFADPEAVAKDETLTPDAPAAGKSYKPYILIAGAIVAFYFILRVSK